MKDVIKLVLSGASYADIAKILGITPEEVESEVLEHRAQSEREVIMMDIERLNAMQAGVWRRARDGEPGSVDRVLKIIKTRQELLVKLGNAETNEKPGHSMDGLTREQMDIELDRIES